MKKEMKVTLLTCRADPNNYTSADRLHAQSPLRLQFHTNIRLDHRKEAKVQPQGLSDFNSLLKFINGRTERQTSDRCTPSHIIQGTVRTQEKSKQILHLSFRIRVY